MSLTGNIILYICFSLWLLLVPAGIILVILASIVYQISFKKFLIRRCNKHEIWLPVVDDTGNIIGRVAQSVSSEMPGKYQHPLIRLIVWSNGKIYLKPRDAEFGFEEGRVDHPFEIRLRYGIRIEDALENIRRIFFPESQKPTFLLKYSYENYFGKWQVLLYYIDVTDLKQLEATFGGGKLWLNQQVRDNIGKSFFSDIFENEVDFFSVLLQEL